MLVPLDECTGMPASMRALVCPHARARRLARYLCAHPVDGEIDAEEGDTVSGGFRR